LADGERQCAGDDADKQRANDARAAVERREPAVRPTKNGNAYTAMVKISQQNRPIPNMLRISPMTSMAAVSATTRCDGRAFHHHDATKSITDGELGWNLFLWS
jgi:hypothetical protein